MTTGGLKARVDRLLNNDVRLDDLSRLLLFTRDHCDGRRTVKEIGDFIAHHDDRNKGLVTEGDWFLTTSFVVPRLQAGVLDLGNLPANFAKVLSASQRRVGSAIIRQQSGLTNADAFRLLPSISKKLLKKDDGTLSVSQAHTATEIKLIETLCSHIVSRPAFDGDKLFAEFEASLQSNSLLKKEDRSRLAGIKPALCLLAVSEMHNCIVQLDEGTTCKLVATISDGTIAVHAPVPCDTGGRTVLWAQAIFATGLAADRYCARSLRDLAEPWKMDIELVLPDLLLSPLG